MPPHILSSIAQISTAIGLYVISEPAKDAMRYLPQQLEEMDEERDHRTSHLGSAPPPLSSYSHHGSHMEASPSSYPQSDRREERRSHFRGSERERSSFSIERLQRQAGMFFRSLLTSDVKWAVVTAGVLAGIGFFFDKRTRWNCMMSATLISVSHFALAKLSPPRHPGMY